MGTRILIDVAEHEESHRKQHKNRESFVFSVNCELAAVISSFMDCLLNSTATKY